MTKKQDKFVQAQLEEVTTQGDIHRHALFFAIEHGHLVKAKMILESTDFDINSLNSDFLSSLDVAVLRNNRAMTKMLLQRGAAEGNWIKYPDSIGSHLNALVHDAENHVQELYSETEALDDNVNTTITLSRIIGNSRSSEPRCTGMEVGKQQEFWKRRIKGLRRLLLGWDQTRPPDIPSTVTISVTGLKTVTIYILEPVDGPLSTKFKIQWSTRAEFLDVVGERHFFKWSSNYGYMGGNLRFTDLSQGCRYFFRASCGNIKGWGPFRASIPNNVVPSSWHTVSNTENRLVGKQRIFDNLFTALLLARPEDASQLFLEDDSSLQRHNLKKKATIKQLFSANSKFQRNLKRGIYLACVLYCDDRILISNDEFLPVIEVDETYPSSLHIDYQWFMKATCTWNDVKSLRNDMCKTSISGVHFRTKLLSAAYQMQSTLCTTDLGQFHYKPLKDSHGTVVLCCVNSVKSAKSCSLLNCRWVSINKLKKRVNVLHNDSSISEILISSIDEFISFHQNSTTKLSRGLYLSYLKMLSSVDQIQLFVPLNTPNVLPHCKIRDNSHISAEEWEVLKCERIPDKKFKYDKSTDVQKMFLVSLTTAAKMLFDYMNLNVNEFLTHRLYNMEVVEMSADVTFLVVCPPVEAACAVPGQREILLERGNLLSLSLQAFETYNFITYRRSIMQKYSRLACIIELYTMMTNHAHREAFSSVEIQATKDRLVKLQEITDKINRTWKSVRWLVDLISFARNKELSPGNMLKEIFDLGQIHVICANRINANEHQQLCKFPQCSNSSIRSNPVRGSWHGPTGSINPNRNGLIVAEYSRSEQNLRAQIINSKILNKWENEVSSIKYCVNSQIGNIYYSMEKNNESKLFIFPLSRSDDYLFGRKKHIASRINRTDSTGNFLANSSPSLSFKSSSGSKHCLSCDSENTNKDKVKLDNIKVRDENYLKSIPVHHENKANLSKEPLHLLESSSLHKSAPTLYKKCVQPCDDDEDFGATLVNSSMVKKNQHSGIIQVYAAYKTGLVHGTSLKLHVTPKTSAKEVIQLVIKQLNMAVILQENDGPRYSSDNLENFCLVAVIGARERCLRDDFKLLQLQNPWRKGRLYVRQKHDLLAAIEHSNSVTQFI